MARPTRSLKTIALLAALTALLGVVATGCGTGDDDAKQEDTTEQPADEATEDGPAGDEATDDGATGDETGDDSADDDAADTSGDEPAEEDEAAADEDA